MKAFKVTFSHFYTNSLLLVVLCCAAFQTLAQQPATGFNREILSPLQKQLNHKTVDEHPNIQPAAYGLEKEFFALSDSSATDTQQTLSVGFTGNLGGGYQLAGKQKALGTGNLGLQISWDQNKNWHAAAGYSIGGGLMPNYLTQLADSLHIIPGMGYAVNDGDGLYHAHYTYGHLSYSNGRHFHFEVGKGKHFWGDGYRSLILSDNATSYPYARITTKIWKLKYTNLWTQLRDISAGQLYKDARTKYAALHALSFNAGKKFNFAIYEMVVWQDRDSNNRRTLDINYLNPIIFYRPVEYSVGSPDNVILAASMRYKPLAKLQFYGQFVLDEFNLAQFNGNKKWWANKFGGQFGLKAFDILTQGLSLQSEINVVRPFTYTHGSPIQSWTATNQSLAHPMGVNFIEWVNFVRFDKGKWKFIEQFTWAAYGRDRDEDGDRIAENHGGNILRSYKDPYGGQYGHKLLQGTRSTFLFHSFTVSKSILENESLEVFLNHSIRYESNEFGRSLDNFFLVGIRATGMLSPANDF